VGFFFEPAVFGGAAITRLIITNTIPVNNSVTTRLRNIS